MSKLNFLTIIFILETGFTDLYSQELSLKDNSGLNPKLGNLNIYDYRLDKPVKKDNPKSKEFRNRIIAGVGFTPGSEASIDLSVVYLNNLKNNLFIGGGLDYNPYIGGVSLLGYYGFPDDRSSFDFLFGGGLSVTVGSDNAGVVIYPLFSTRFDVHLNRFNSIGFEIKAPYIGAGDQIIGDVYLVGNLGFKF